MGTHYGCPSRRFIFGAGIWAQVRAHFFHGPERGFEAGERTEVTPKLKPYPMLATVSLRDIACSYTSFVLRHTSTLNPNPELQRHLDPAGFFTEAF